MARLLLRRSVLLSVGLKVPPIPLPFRRFPLMPWRRLVISNAGTMTRIISGASDGRIPDQVLEGSLSVMRFLAENCDEPTGPSGDPLSGLVEPRLSAKLRGSDSNSDAASSAWSASGLDFYSPRLESLEIFLDPPENRWTTSKEYRGAAGVRVSVDAALKHYSSGDPLGKFATNFVNRMVVRALVSVVTKQRKEGASASPTAGRESFLSGGLFSDLLSNHSGYLLALELTCRRLDAGVANEDSSIPLRGLFMPADHWVVSDLNELLGGNNPMGSDFNINNEG